MKDRDYRDYFDDIISAINDIHSFIAGMNYDEFLADRKTFNAVIRSLEIIGEAVKSLPEEMKLNYRDVPWKKIAGMRDKLIHGYFGMDNEIIWKTITENINPLLEQIKKIRHTLE